MVENESVYDALIAEAVEVKPTYEALELLLTQHADEITRLTNLNGYYNRVITEERQRRNNEVDELEKYLDEHWDDLSDHAEEIAKIFPISMTKEVSLTIEVEFEVTVTVPRGYNVDDISEDDFDFEVSAYGDVDIESSSANVQSVNNR
jgi:hypothetical protein